MRNRIDEKLGIQDKENSGRHRKQDRIHPATDQSSEKKWDDQAGEARPEFVMPVLKCNQRILGEVADIRIIVMGTVDTNPPNVSVKEAALDIVWVAICIRVAMMQTVQRRPSHRRLLERRSAKKQYEQADRPCRFEGDMRKKAMIAKGYCKQAGQSIEGKKTNLGYG